MLQKLPLLKQVQPEMTYLELQRRQRRRLASFWGLLILVMAFCPQVVGQSGRPTIAQYLQQKAMNAVYIAGNATENEQNCGEDILFER